MEPPQVGRAKGRSGSLDWTQPEVAWPLALFAGFAGTWVGLLGPLPGLADLGAAACFAPILWLQLRAGRLRDATLLTLGWCIGVAGAVYGSILELSFRGEHTFETFAERLPLARPLVDELTRWSQEGAGIAPEMLLGRGVSLLALCVAARTTRGMLALPLLALYVGATAGVAGWLSWQGRSAGVPLAELALLSWPPATLLQLVGAAVAATALAAAGFEGGEDSVQQRRALLRAGLAVALIGLALEPLAAPHWARWIAARFGLGP